MKLILIAISMLFLIGCEGREAINCDSFSGESQYIDEENGVYEIRAIPQRLSITRYSASGETFSPYTIETIKIGNAIILQDVLVVFAGRNFEGDEMSCSKYNEVQSGYSGRCVFEDVEGRQFENEYDFVYGVGVTKIKRKSPGNGFNIRLISEFGLGADCFKEKS